MPTITKMTPDEQTKVSALVEKILDAVEPEEHREDEFLSALAFCLFAVIEARHNLSPRETVEFCAKQIKTYGQVVFS